VSSDWETNAYLDRQQISDELCKLGYQTCIVCQTRFGGPNDVGCICGQRKLRTFPTLVCLCGSTRFLEAFREANYRETLAGKIVLSIGCVTSSDSDLGLDDETKSRLDELHKRKIDLADEILVLNVGGYIGESTRSEIEYAERQRKTVRYLEPSFVEKD